MFSPCEGALNALHTKDYKWTNNEPRVTDRSRGANESARVERETKAIVVLFFILDNWKSLERRIERQ